MVMTYLTCWLNLRASPVYMRLTSSRSNEQWPSRMCEGMSRNRSASRVVRRCSHCSSCNHRASLTSCTSNIGTLSLARGSDKISTVGSYTSLRGRSLPSMQRTLLLMR